MRAGPAWAVAALAALAAAAALADEPGDPVEGRAVAQKWCSECHDVEPGGRFKQDPPAFAAIAVYRDDEHIRANILYPHAGMPEVAKVFGLNVDDLVAYMRSIEATAQPAGES